MLVLSIAQLLLLCGIRSASAGKGSPIEKVIDLLGVLEKQIEDDGLADGEAYVKYRKWYDNEVDNMKRIVEESSQTIESLQADLDEQSAFRQGKTQEFETVSGKLSSSEKDLADAKLIRDKEHKDFVANEKSLVVGVEQLEKSLDVMAKQAPGDSAAAAGAASASFLDVAQKLQSTLVDSGDFTLSAGQKETLRAFIEASKRNVAPTATSGQSALALDFLQVQGQASGPDDYGNYESQGSGVTNTLQAVLDKVNEQLDAAREQEGKQKSQYDTFSEALDQEITNFKGTRDELKTQITQSQQKSSEMESQLAKTSQVLKVTKEQLTETKAEFDVKTKNYKMRAAKRSDEIMAVQEAHQILGSQTMPAASIGGADFLQVRRLSMRSNELLSKALTKAGSRSNSSVVNFLEVRSTHTRGRRSRRRVGGPFTKVKNMITSMLRKLEDQAGKEAKHKEWCDREMKKSLTSKAEQEADIQKLTSRVDALDAELSQVGNDLKTVQEDLSNLHGSASSATAIRKTEHHQATTAVAEYKDAQKVIQAAIDALKKFYGDDGSLLQKNSGKDPDSDSGYKAQGGGGGVIGILEVALQDYADLENDVGLAEKEAANEFKTYMQESEVRIAVFEKDLEYKSRDKVKLEGDLLRSNADLKSYQKELDAVEEYLRELESQCIGKVDSYQERKDRRNKQLASLKEGLQYLNGEIV